VDYSGSGLKMTEQFEGCRLDSYQDSAGVWTVGFGHTLGVQPGQTITQLQAEAFLLQDMQRAVKYVNMLVKVPLTQGEFDALVDFAFNVGCGALADSTLLKLLNAGDYSGAANQFDAWDHAAGQVVAGLLRRRQAETDEFNSQIQPV
jgi:lysozyme